MVLNTETDKYPRFIKKKKNSFSINLFQEFWTYAYIVLENDIFFINENDVYALLFSDYHRMKNSDSQCFVFVKHISQPAHVVK